MVQWQDVILSLLFRAHIEFLPERELYPYFSQWVITSMKQNCEHLHLPYGPCPVYLAVPARGPWVMQRQVSFTLPWSIWFGESQLSVVFHHRSSCFRSWVNIFLQHLDQMAGHCAHTADTERERRLVGETPWQIRIIHRSLVSQWMMTRSTTETLFGNPNQPWWGLGLSPQYHHIYRGLWWPEVTDCLWTTFPSLQQSG